MKGMRYVWAGIFAVATISLGVVFVWRTSATFEQRVRKTALESCHPWPEGSDSQVRGNFGIEVSSSEMLGVKLADLLISYWYFFVAIVLAVCFGFAALVGRLNLFSARTSGHREN
jgi:hypothetical protein